MKKLLVLLTAALIISTGGAYADTVKIPAAPAAAPAAQTVTSAAVEKGLSTKGIDTIILMIEKESAYKVKIPKLCNGAIKEMREYLKNKRLYKEQIPLLNENLSPEEALKEFNAKYEAIRAKCPESAREALSYNAASGALKAIGDPYAAFMDPKAYKAFNDQMKGGNFGGIGVYVHLNEDKKCIEVLEAIEDMPAERAGLKKGDQIIKINGEPVEKMESLAKANEKLRGEPGSSVTVTVRRAKLDPFNVTITREVIVAKSVSYKMLNGAIGYIRINIFAEKTGEEMYKAVNSLERQGARGYIIDLRGNGGGYVTSAIQTVSLFVPTKSSVVTLVKEGTKDNPYLSIPNVRYGAPPMAILIDKGSASASEITAGALQDHEKAKLIGTISYGKASVQKVYPLEYETGMKFTTSHYITPKRRQIDKVGITPDTEIKLPDSKAIRSEKDDLQLQEAIKAVSEKISKEKSGNGTSMEDAIKSPSYSSDLKALSDMFPDGYEIKRSEMAVSGDEYYEHYEIESRAGVKNVWFTRGIYTEK